MLLYTCSVCLLTKNYKILSFTIHRAQLWIRLYLIINLINSLYLYLSSGYSKYKL